MNSFQLTEDMDFLSIDAMDDRREFTEFKVQLCLAESQIILEAHFYVEGEFPGCALFAHERGADRWYILNPFDAQALFRGYPGFKKKLCSFHSDLMKQAQLVVGLLAS